MGKSQVYVAVQAVVAPTRQAVTGMTIILLDFEILEPSGGNRVYDQVGVCYDIVDVSEVPDFCHEYGITSTPSLVSASRNLFEHRSGLSDIKEWLYIRK